jgi:shikimate dehydrogenase
MGRQQLRFPGGPGTRVFAIIGHPVAHSLSPRFQQAALRAMGLDAVYLAVDVTPEALDAAWHDLVRAAEQGLLGGVNVTVPHKSVLLGRVHTLDAVARLAGAVNVLHFVGSPEPFTIHGHNTDVDGLLAALAEEGRSLAGVPVVIVGAGGMARAAAVAALRSGAAEIRVLARTPERAEAMLQSVASGWQGSLPPLRWDSLQENRRRHLADAGVLIQATSQGLQPQDSSPLSLEGAPPDLFVFEAIYNPPQTALLREARKKGLAAVNGLGMLLHQGAAALRLWTGREPPLELMRESLR